MCWRMRRAALRRRRGRARRGRVRAARWSGCASSRCASRGGTPTRGAWRRRSWACDVAGGANRRAELEASFGKPIKAHFAQISTARAPIQHCACAQFRRRQPNIQPRCATLRDAAGPTQSATPFLPATRLFACGACLRRRRRVRTPAPRAPRPWHPRPGAHWVRARFRRFGAVSEPTQHRKRQCRSTPRSSGRSARRRRPRVCRACATYGKKRRRCARRRPPAPKAGAMAQQPTWTPFSRVARCAARVAARRTLC